MRTPLIAGNWKMFKNIAESKAFAKEFKDIVGKPDVNVCICAPFLQLQTLVDEFKDSDICVGAQNVHFEDEGAFTGEVSAPMLKEVGVDYCVVGHSERRQYFGETDEAIALKLSKLFENQITPILCVGESLDQREGGVQEQIVGKQIEADLAKLHKEQVAKMVIAYEPIWAIGTGLTASKEQAEEMCAFIRKTVAGLYGQEAAEKVIIQYGGSVKPENVKDIMSMENIDGALVGGASLIPDKFNQIVHF